MAQEPQEKGNDGPEEKEMANNDANKFFDPKKEEELMDTMLELALLNPDEDKNRKWTKYNSGDKTVTVHYDYEMLKDDANPKNAQSITTIRSDTLIDITPLEFYQFQEGHTQCILDHHRMVDKMTQEIYYHKVLDDKEHAVIYAKITTGSAMADAFIWPRDFVQMRFRVHKKNYKLKSGKEIEEFSAGMIYSIPEDHPLGMPTKDGIVRSEIKYLGFIFIKEGDQSRMVYVSRADPGGVIPGWIVKIAAPGQGMIVTGYKKTVKYIKDEAKKLREK